MFAFAFTWHLLAVMAGGWSRTHHVRHGRDFASYHYAVEVAVSGGNPYDVGQLQAAARQDRIRNSVHPYLYAPPFLLMMSWTQAFDLPRAFHLWFWLHTGLGVLTAWGLWRWWRPWGGDLIGVCIALAFALMTAVPNNHAMGQANFAGLGLALAGLALAQGQRPAWGGVAMGAACMLKMSPALFVMWWILRREWTAVIAACATGLGLSLLALTVVAGDVQIGFFTEVLPTFGAGSYNGLRVPIGLFGNHSVPNLWDAALPHPGFGLGPAARLASQVSALALLAAVAVAFRRPVGAPDGLAAQIACVGVVILLVPVFTYEHHLVFAIPALAVSAWAAATGRLPVALTALAAASFVVLCFDLQALKRMAEADRFGLSWLGGLFRELKFGGLIGLLITTAYLGSAHDDATLADPRSRRPPLPTP
ncbi:MAG: glycosyltransferase family 87 protein [Myxococcota bacterium]